MATRTDTTIVPSNSTDAQFRAWAQFIEDTLVTTGAWVVTGDTGQMTISSAAHPTTTNTKVGYRVYRMDDSLQSTAAVYMRVDYGSGSAANTPAIWLTIGQSSDGAGNITNVRMTVTQFTGGGNTTTGSFTAYGSAENNRVQVALFIQATITYCFAFSLERTRNASGTLTGDGLLFYARDEAIAGAVAHQRYIVLSSGAQPPLEQGLLYILSGANPTGFGSDIGVGIPIPMKGVAQPPGTGVVVVRSNDFTTESQFNVTLYGSTRNYVQLNSLTCANGRSGTGASDSTSRACIRYD